MKKLLLTLLCVFALAATSQAATKTYELCTDLNEILNPDNQFVILSARSMKASGVNHIYAAPKTGTSCISVMTTTNTGDGAPETIDIDVESQNIGIFSFVKNGEKYGLFESQTKKYWGLQNANSPGISTSDNLPSDNVEYQLSVELTTSTDGKLGEGKIKISSGASNSRNLMFSGSNFKNYTTNNYSGSYACPAFYKEKKSGPVLPKFGNYKENYDIEKGQFLNFPAITPADLIYTISTEDSDVIAINNEEKTITGIGIGTAIVKFQNQENETFLASDGTFTVTVSKITPSMEFRDQVVYGKLGKGVVWEPVIVTDPEDHSLCGEITYSSSDPEMVEIDAESGQIHPEGVKAAGEVVITATMAENGDYAEGTASYTVIIIDPDAPAEPATAVFDFSGENPYGMTSLSSGNTYETKVKEIEETVTISFSGNYRSWHNTTSGTYELRLQKNSSMTISVPEGFKISKIGLVALGDSSGDVGGSYSPEGKTTTVTGSGEEVENSTWAPKDGEVVNSVTYNAGSSNVTKISKIYVLYEAESSNLLSADLSFNKVINSVYVDEETILNAVVNPYGREITYSIQNLEENQYSITPVGEDKIKVCIHETGYYTLQAKSPIGDDYRDGFAIMRVNVYRHLDLTENGEAHTYPDPINTKEAVEVVIEVPELNTLYYKLDILNAPATQANEATSDDEEQEQEPGFEQYEDVIDIPANAKGTLTFYIAAYGYKSPKRTILLGSASVVGFEHEVVAFGQSAQLGYTIHINGHEEGEQYEVTLKIDGKEFSAIVDEASIEDAEAPQNAPKRVAPAADATITHVARGTVKAPLINLTGAPQTHDVEVTLSHNGKILEEHTYTGTASTTGQTGIENVAVDSNDNAPAEFFTLEGIHVSEPAAGQLYIKRQGGKAVKVLVK